MSDEKTQAKITVHLNCEYEGRPELLFHSVREFLQELCDMGAKQIFFLDHDFLTATIELEASLNGSASVVATETVTFSDTALYDMTRLVLHRLTKRCTSFAESEIEKALEELKKPEIVHVPTGVTYSGYPVTLRVTGRGQALADDIAEAEATAGNLRASVVGGFNKSWTLVKNATPAKPHTIISARVKDLTTVYPTGTY